MGTVAILAQVGQHNAEYPSILVVSLRPQGSPYCAMGISLVRTCTQEPSGKGISVNPVSHLQVDTEQIMKECTSDHANFSRSILCYGPSVPRYECCIARGEAAIIPEPASTVESLKYSPSHFEDTETMDVERSHVRYANTFAHTKSGRHQRQSLTLEEWLHCAASGREILLLTSRPEPIDKLIPSCNRIPAVYTLDRAFTKLTIYPGEVSENGPIVILVSNLLVICPASDFEPLFDNDQAMLSELEMERAVLLQYATDVSGSGYKCVCFLEKSAIAADSFVDAVTALWLERRGPEAPC